MNPVEMHEKMKKLRNGTDVVCTECNKGVFKPCKNTNYKTTHGFVCNKCGAMISID